MNKDSSLAARAIDYPLGGNFATCQRCQGEGDEIDCCDDMCHGIGHCIHGDYKVCPECHGTGEVEDYDDD